MAQHLLFEIFVYQLQCMYKNLQTMESTLLQICIMYTFIMYRVSHLQKGIPQVNDIHFSGAQCTELWTGPIPTWKICTLPSISLQNTEQSPSDLSRCTAQPLVQQPPILFTDPVQICTIYFMVFSFRARRQFIMCSNTLYKLKLTATPIPNRTANIFRLSC